MLCYGKDCRGRGGWKALWVTVIFLYSAPTANNVVQSQTTTNAERGVSAAPIQSEARKYWEWIRGANADTHGVFDQDFEAHLEGYWLRVAGDAMSTFDEMMEGSGAAEKLGYFVDQFGVHGPQADMRWLLAAPGATLNRCGGPEGGLCSADSERGRKERRVRLLLAEFQVKAFLKDPEKLARYYQAVAWNDQLLRPVVLSGQVYSVKRFFPNTPERPEYWWYARDFMVFAYATGRQDLLAGMKCTELQGQFLNWLEWFVKEDGPYLRPSVDGPYWYVDEGEKRRQEGYVPFIKKLDLPPLVKVPEYPFPDWKGPPPPHRFVSALAWRARGKSEKESSALVSGGQCARVSLDWNRECESPAMKH